MNRMLSIAYPFLGGIAFMAILVAATSYVNPGLRCIGEQGTVWVSAPVSKCYPITQFVPAGALQTAK